MKNHFLFLALFSSGFCALGQEKSDSVKQATVLIVPYQNMMYFSDADRDISRFSNLSERELVGEMANQVEVDVYHQLLSAFNAISLKRATSLNGSEDLQRIYAGTLYTPLSREQKKEYHTQQGISESGEVSSLINSYNKKTKDRNFWVTDSSVMLGAIQAEYLFPMLKKKYQADYLLVLSQFEIETSNKNTIEWTKQEYNRTYTLHYNLYDMGGRLLRAEMISVRGANDNRITDINTKYIQTLASRLKEIMVAACK